MSRESERLLDALGEIREEMLNPILDHRQPARRSKWKPWAALAAVLVLAVGLWRFLPRMGGSSSGGTGSSGSSVFMSYAGPILPLTAVEQTESITASREITLDFSPWAPVWISNKQQVEKYKEQGAAPEELEDYRQQLEEWFPEGGYEKTSTDILVKDDYLLTNTGETEQSFTLLYPFASALNQLEQLRPQLTVAGEKMETTLRWGGYSGGFQGALGENLSAEAEEGSVNLRQLNSWTQYQALLSDGSYQIQALGTGESLEGIPVTIYQFSDPWGPEAGEEIPNPTIRVTYRQPEDTTVLSYGFHGMSRDEETGEMGQSFSIPEPQESRYGKNFYMIVIGEDIQEMEVAGYATGGRDTVEQVEAGVTVERYEGDLDGILRRIFQEYMTENTPSPDMDQEMWYQQFVELLTSSGPLSSQSAQRYASGWLEDLISETRIISRVFYLETEVTIAPGQTLQVTAEMTKNASYDFACAKTENRGVCGYDLMTTLGSGFLWKDQQAILEDRGQIEIVRQNFGFDLEQGIYTAKLNPQEEHYYLEVRRKEKR